MSNHGVIGTVCTVQVIGGRGSVLHRVALRRSPTTNRWYWLDSLDPSPAGFKKTHLKAGNYYEHEPVQSMSSLCAMWVVKKGSVAELRRIAGRNGWNVLFRSEVPSLSTWNERVRQISKASQNIGSITTGSTVDLASSSSDGSRSKKRPRSSRKGSKSSGAGAGAGASSSKRK